VASSAHSAFSRWLELAGWLRDMARPLFAAIGDLVTNRPEPTRQVALDTLAALLAGWAVTKVVRRLKP
jgi:hypothetical protein